MNFVNKSLNTQNHSEILESLLQNYSTKCGMVVRNCKHFSINFEGNSGARSTASDVVEVCLSMFCVILHSTRYLLPEFNFIMLLSGHQYTCRNKLLVILCWLLVWLDPCDVIDCCYSVTPHHADPVWRTYLVSAMVYYMPVLLKKWCTDFYILSVCLLLLAVWL